MAELNHMIEIEVGDFSKDGHNQSDIVYIKSNYSGEEIDKGFERLNKKTGIDFQNICDEYEDTEVSEKDLEKFVKHGFLTQEEIDEYSEDGEYHIDDARDLALFALDTLHKFDPKFEYEQYTPKTEQCFALMGIGYGCYH